MVALANEKVIDEREFLDAQSTLSHIANAIRQRVEQLRGIVKYFPTETGFESHFVFFLLPSTSQLQTSRLRCQRRDGSVRGWRGKN